MSGAKFEARFEGRDNAGLRDLIRGAVRVASNDPSVHRPARIHDAVMGVARYVALTASGNATLRAVADDYRAAFEAAAERLEDARR
jgi:hypothetical protein